MRILLTLLFPLLATALAASPVAAQGGNDIARPLPPGSTLVLLPGGDLEGVAPNSHLPAAGFEKQVRAALVEAIQQVGYHPMVAEKARGELIRRGKLSTCRDIMSCDRRATLQELSADAVVVYALWLRDGKPAQLTVTVTRADFEGSSSRTATEKSLRTETKALFASALTKAEREQRVMVQIDSDPQGATITIDRKHTKTAPAQFELKPGAHQVVAELKGYVTVLDGFELEADEHVYRQTLSLEKVADEQAAHSVTGNSGERWLDQGYQGPQETEASATADYVIGGVLAAGAIGLITVGTVMALSDGDCARRTTEDDVCLLRKDAGGYPYWLAGGAVAAVGSASMFIFTPFASLQGDTAGLQLRGQF